MERCRDCNSTLMPGEEQCYNCGAPVKVQETAQTVFGRRFISFLNFAFFGSAIMTVVSLFTDLTPPFIRCLMLTFILLLARSSAAQMLERKKE